MANRVRFPGSLMRRMLALTFLAAASLPAQAQFATGGSGRFHSQIFWFDWGNSGASIPAVGTTVTNSVTVAGRQLRVTCSISNVVGALGVYRPGGWRGDGLDDLYNIGGLGGANTMDIGLRNSISNARASFDFSCSATLGAVGDPNPPAFPLAGLVFADAEQSGSNEYVEATIASAGTTWRVIDRFRNCTASTTNAVRTDGGGSSTLRLANTFACPSSGPMGVAFMEGTTTASAVVQGGANSAIALGVVVVSSSDFGDAPASYGEPVHTAQPAWSGGTLASNAATDIFGTFGLADLVEPNVRLGNRVDADLVAAHGANADGDDLAGVDDEDGLTQPLGVLIAVPGQTFTTPPIACNGGTVRGWIDFNRDGDFADAGEVSVNSPVCSGSTVTLNWTVPAGAVAGRTYLRLRTATVASQIDTAVGTANDGEVEDYMIEALAPAVVTLVKQVSSRADPADQFTVSVLDGTTVSGSATTSGTAANASTGRVGVTTGTAHTLRDANASGAALLRYVHALACVANAGSTGAVPVPTGPTGTGPADWSMTFNDGNDLTCTITNTPNQADLAITKTNGRTTSTHGQASQYTVTVTNNGPGIAIGAVVSDPAQPGVDCPAANPVTCTGAAGACPAGTITVADLQAGVTMGTIPATGSNTATLQFTCTVQ